jgi:hypothetical protein
MPTPTIAIKDVHGCSRALDSLRDAIETYSHIEMYRYDGSWLTALDVHTEVVWQTNWQGQLRRSRSR